MNNTPKIDPSQTIMKCMRNPDSITPATILRELRLSKSLRSMPDTILSLFVKFSSDECYHCNKLRCDGSEKEQETKWMQFYDGWVCRDCLVEQCICMGREELSDSAFGHTTYCDNCASALCVDCRQKSLCCLLAMLSDEQVD